MRDLPEFTIDDIRPHFDDGSWARGLGDARYGHILNAQVAGQRLSAECQGSRSYPYKVRAVWHDDNLSAQCSCPIGAWGECKHVVALLVTWIEHPEDFAQLGNLDALLSQASPEQLRSALAWVIESHPRANAGIMRWLMAPEAWPCEMVRQEIVRLLRLDHDHHDAYDDDDEREEEEDDYDDEDRVEHTVEAAPAAQLPEEVSAWRARAYACLDAGDLRAAFEISKGMIEGLENGRARRLDLSAALQACLVDMLKLLSQILAQAQDKELRAALIEFLVRIHGWESHAAQRALGDMALQALSTHLDRIERQRVAQPIQKELLIKSSSWGLVVPPPPRRCQLLYALLDEQLQDPQALLDLAQSLHDVPTQIDALIRLDRLQAALAMLLQANAATVGPYVAAFARHHQEDAALDWLIARGLGSEISQPWLDDLLRDYGRWVDLVPLLRNQAYRQPRWDRIIALRDAAQHLDGWEDERAALAAHLQTQGDWPSLVDLYLADELWLEALEALEQVRPEQVSHDLQCYREQVALIVQQPCPLEASLIFAESVELCIAKRNRTNYAKAAQWLRFIRDCYRRMNEEEAWRAYLQDLTNEYQNLRALADELRRAGL